MARRRLALLGIALAFATSPSAAARDPGSGDDPLSLLFPGEPFVFLGRAPVAAPWLAPLLASPADPERIPLEALLALHEETIPPLDLVNPFPIPSLAEAGDLLPTHAAPAAQRAPAPRQVRAPDPMEAGAAPAPSPVPVGGEVVVAAAAAVSLVAVGWASGLVAPLGAKLKHFLLGLAGFTRIGRERVLEHELRERIYSRVLAEPGVALSALVAAFGGSRSTVAHHLRVLERQGLVFSAREGRRRLHFPSSAGASRADSVAFAALSHSTGRAIAERVAREPGVDQRTLGEELDLAPSLAHWHVKRLSEAGVVERVRDGRRVRCYPGPIAGRVLPAAGGVVISPGAP